MRPVRVRHYAIDQIMAIAKTTNDPDTKQKLAQHINDLATGSPSYGRLVYRIIAIALGAVAILAVVFAFVLLLNKKTVNAAFYTLGSAAIGALGGVFAAPSQSGGAAGPAPAGNGGAAGPAPAGNGGAAGPAPAGNGGAAGPAPAGS
jgi:hypothetical protein